VRPVGAGNTPRELKDVCKLPSRSIVSSYFIFKTVYMPHPLVPPCRVENDERFEALVQFFDETLGFCPNSVRTMYHRPEIAYAFIALNRAVMQNEGRVSSVLKRLIGYVSSHAAGCRYCQAHTIRAAQRFGADDEQLHHVWEFQHHPAFNAAERAALSFALASSTVPSRITVFDIQQLQAHWNEGEIVEITGVIALFGFLNRWNDSMGTTLEAPARDSGQQYLGGKGWTPGKHVAEQQEVERE
jgi:uncharacterized peroxidase-related enzyme